MTTNKRKIRSKWLAVLLAAILVFALGGCSSSKDSGNNSNSGSAGSKVASETATEAATEDTASQTEESYAAPDVVLPDNFDNMIYPIEALMVEEYSKGQGYYPESGEADSFWYSMAVLTSLMENESAYGDGIEKDSYYYLQENTTDMYASVLYYQYAKGGMEFPEIPDDDQYVTYDDEQGMYGFVKGDVGSLTPYITEVLDNTITAQLRDSETGEVKATYEIELQDTLFEGDDNHFAYTVSSVQEKTDDSSVDFGEKSTENTSETGTTQNDSQTGTTASTEDSTAQENATEDNSGDTTEKQNTESSGISQSDALGLAKDYYGDDADYSYKETVTVGDKDYYDFSVKGEDISSTDVLVSTDGEDVIGGTKNNDGSWSFDQ